MNELLLDGSIVSTRPLLQGANSELIKISVRRRAARCVLMSTFVVHGIKSNVDIYTSSSRWRVGVRSVVEFNIQIARRV